LESSFLHVLRFRIPVEFELLFNNGHSFALSAAPFVQLDILSQDRKYSERVSSSSAAGGFEGSIVYRYYLSEKMILGLKSSFSITAYNNPQIIIIPSILIEYNLKGGSSK
jgi:hypothetical protein